MSYLKGVVDTVGILSPSSLYSPVLNNTMRRRIKQKESTCITVMFYSTGGKGVGGIEMTRP